MNFITLLVKKKRIDTKMSKILKKCRSKKAFDIGASSIQIHNARK